MLGFSFDLHLHLLPARALPGARAYIDGLTARHAASFRSVSRVTGVAGANAPRRADNPVPEVKMLRAAFRSAWSAWPQATHSNFRSFRFSGSVNPQALHDWLVYAGLTSISSKHL